MANDVLPVTGSNTGDMSSMQGRLDRFLKSGFINGFGFVDVIIFAKSVSSCIIYALHTCHMLQ